MNITIFGTGYVGLVTGACLADVGHNVLCMDVDQAKIAKLENGQIPIFEPGLENIVRHTVEAGRLSFTTDAEKAVKHSNLQFIAVGTPPDEDGSADLQYVTAVARSIGQYMDDYTVVVDKSTVPVGTADKVKAAVRAQLDSRGLKLEFDVVSNPEFLKEGAAINDFMKPDRIIIGCDSDRAAKLLQEVYSCSSFAARSLSQPMMMRSGFLKSLFAAPSLRNSGFDTTSNSNFRPRLSTCARTAALTLSAVPTGTVDLSTTTV